MTSRKAKPKETPPLEARQEPKQQEQPKEQPQQQAKQQQPKEQAKPRSPKVKRVTWTYFERFNPNRPNSKSWVKEAIEMAKKEPIMVSGLSRGQLMSLLNQVDRHNMNTDHKIVYKHDVKRGIVLLAPKDVYMARLKQQGEGDQK